MRIVMPLIGFFLNFISAIYLMSIHDINTLTILIMVLSITPVLKKKIIYDIFFCIYFFLFSIFSFGVFLNIYYHDFVEPLKGDMFSGDYIRLLSFLFLSSVFFYYSRRHLKKLM